MNSESLKTRIAELLPEAQIEENKQFPVFIIPAEKLYSLAEQLKNGDDTAFDYLFCLTGTDMVKYLMVTYHLNSTRYGHDLVLKVKTEDREHPAFDSLTGIYPAAEFYEREVYDMLGIKFNNHPDLRRIFLDENWKGYPFRKDYVDEVNIVEL